MNIANWVTYSRVLLIPVIIVFFHSPAENGRLIAAFLFTIASISDWLDGFLARKLNQASSYGAFIDPVADKLLVVVMLITLVAEHPVLLTVVSVLIARELLVSALREWMASMSKREAVAVDFTGKIKTTVQMLAIIALLLYSDSSPGLLWTLG
ncbi:MAG: CDP-diacylglycerol--glycerol-3-phosphate 3-phosphatidyltransferase, partial [Gammaproteobacteria bacterium]